MNGCTERELMPDDMLTPAEAARVLKVSKGTVVKIFAKMTGVKNLGTEGSLNKRRRRLLRIPRAVVERYVGHPITVPSTAKTKPKVKSRDPLFVVEASQRVAQSVLENARKDQIKATLDTIAFNAKILAMVPEEQWGDIEHIGRDDDYDER